jgi:hypothetical protein
MKTLILYVPLDGSVRDFMRFVRMFRDAGYRFTDCNVEGDVAGITFVLGEN